MKNLYLTVDLGGTSLRTALLDSEGNILHLISGSSEEVRDPDQLAVVLARECQILIQRAETNSILGLALGIPGLVDGERGIVYQSPHFPRWKEIPLKKPLEKIFPFPIFMDNDANQAALGEAWRGAGKDWPDFVMLTLGTGIGGGIISGGKIFHGPFGFAGEVGHLIIDRQGLRGALGSRGTLESIASQSGLRLKIKSLQQGLSTLPREINELEANAPQLPEDLQKLAQQRNKIALEIWDDFGRALACGIASLAHTLGIFNFVIGGGLAEAWDLFIEPCFREIRARLYPCTLDKLQIVRAKLGNEAGLIGGVRIIQSSL